MTYDSPEHESLRAIVRCTLANFGQPYAEARTTELKRFFRIDGFEQLSPFGANKCRKLLQDQLPLRGDYA